MHHFRQLGGGLRALRPGGAARPSSACMCTTAAAASAAGVSSLLGSTLKGAALRVGSAVVLGGGACVAWSRQPAAEADSEPSSSSSAVRPALPWVQRLVERDSVQEVLSPGQMLRNNALGRVLVEQDHLFEGMVQSGQIVELRCFYDQAAKQFYSVVQLGRDVCGFPHTVHGGLTAAIMDETLGGLGVCLWRAGALGFRPPAYTARLEVDFKHKIPSGSVIMCSTQLERVEDRKIWMTAEVTNGSGLVFASARALFVAPRLQTFLLGWIPGFGQK